MTFITYKEYIHYLNNMKIIQLKDTKENYNLETQADEIYDEEKVKQIYKLHDKMFKDILGNKEEMNKFLNQFLDLKYKIQKDDLVQCSTNFITKNYKERYSDIIYKLKKEPVYFLVEHQSTIDNNMPFRIFEYVGEIMRKESILQKTYLNEKRIYPIVVPIVIYTGYKTWNVTTNFSKKQYQIENYEEYLIDLKYNLISIQDYTFKELLEKRTMLANIMIIEKCNNLNKDETQEQINNIIKTINNEKDREKFAKIIDYIITPIIGKQKTNELLDKLYGKGESGMSPFTKSLFDLEIKGRKEGKKESLLSITKKMIEKKMKIKDIEEITGLTKKEIEKIV